MCTMSGCDGGRQCAKLACEARMAPRVYVVVALGSRVDSSL